LYLTLLGKPLPERLPEAWRARWEARLGRALTPTLLDAPPRFDVPRREAIATQNARTAERLLAWLG
jgi:acetoin utilization protein AcuC